MNERYECLVTYFSAPDWSSAAFYKGSYVDMEEAAERCALREFRDSGSANAGDARLVFVRSPVDWGFYRVHLEITIETSAEEVDDEGDKTEAMACLDDHLHKEKT